MHRSRHVLVMHRLCDMVTIYANTRLRERGGKVCDPTKMHAENGIDLRELPKQGQLDLSDALVQTNKQCTSFFRQFYVLLAILSMLASTCANIPRLYTNLMKCKCWLQFSSSTTTTTIATANAVLKRCFH